MKKIIITLISLTIVGLIAFTLYANKKEMVESAKLAEVTSDAIPVEITQIAQKELDLKVTADGTFEATTDLTVLSETQGKVIKVYKEKGSQVRKGELLSQVENDLLQAEVEASQANYEKLQSDLERFEKLSESDAVTKRQLEDVRIGLKNADAQYRSAKKRLDNTYIRATACGNINDDFIQEGAFIGVGAKLYEIVDVSRLKINVKLTANDILKVHETDKVVLTSSVYPNEQFIGSVKAIASKADASLKYAVEIELDNSQEKSLKPGMYATAHFDFKSDESKSYLDRNALIGSIQNPQVFVVNNDLAKLTNISIGEIHSDMVEVVKGLSAGDKVVLTGHINLATGTKVKILK